MKNKHLRRRSAGRRRFDEGVHLRCLPVSLDYPPLSRQTELQSGEFGHDGSGAGDRVGEIEVAIG